VRKQGRGLSENYETSYEFCIPLFVLQATLAVLLLSVALEIYKKSCVFEVTKSDV
jgi:hypothetical protein